MLYFVTLTNANKACYQTLTINNSKHNFFEQMLPLGLYFLINLDKTWHTNSRTQLLKCKGT